MMSIVETNVLAWWPGEHISIHWEVAKVVRLAHDETSYFQGFLLHPLDHIPSVVAIVGMPLHYFLMIMVGWLVMTPPILHLKKS